MQTNTFTNGILSNSFTSFRLSLSNTISFIVDALERRTQPQSEMIMAGKVNKEEDYFSSFKSYTKWYKDSRKETIDLLLKNEQVLNELFNEFKSSEIERRIFIDKGFNFNYGTHTQLLGSEPVISVFSINYCRLKNGKIKILNL